MSVQSESKHTKLPPGGKHASELPELTGDVITVMVGGNHRDDFSDDSEEDLDCDASIKEHNVHHKWYDEVCHNHVSSFDKVRVTGSEWRKDNMEKGLGNAGSEIFHVHRRLCQTSGFFRAATKPEWSHGAEPRAIDLTDVSPAAFKTYLQWLYTKKIGFNTHQLKNDEGTVEEEAINFEPLAEAYVLGEKIMDFVFQNVVMDTLMSAIQGHGQPVEYPGEATIRIIYSGTTSCSPARKLLVDLWTWEAYENWLGEDDLLHTTCSQFVSDLARALIKSRRSPKGSPPWRKNTHEYHVVDKAPRSTR